MTHYVALSGGLDSTVALAVAVDEHPDDVTPVSFDYGQKHKREVLAADDVTTHYGLGHVTVRLPQVMRSPALLDGGPVPDGHYAHDTMRQTIVTGRNLLFASTLVAMAQPGDHVWLGVHAGDHAIYPDCRPEFWRPLKAAVLGAYEVTIRTPFLTLDKTGIVRLGAHLKAPLAQTWSCYKGGDQHCGRCGTCVERAEAFALAHVPDWTGYADPDFWKTATA